MNDQTMNTNKRLHPLLVGAAASVMVLSLVGVAAMTGNLPGTSAEKAEPPKAEAQKAPQAKSEAPKRMAAAPAAQQKPVAAKCTDCGTVIETKQVNVKGDGSGAGAVIGGVLGAVVGHQVGDGRALGTAAGAGVGAVAGHQVERHAKAHTRYEVVARMEDGTVRTGSSSQPMPWKVGDRVRVADGKVSPVN